MQVRIHRGATQIGGSCVEIAYAGSRIVLDFGLPLDGDAADAALAPQVFGPDLKAILISHPHIDHYGLLGFVPEGVPVVMGDAARRIISAAIPFTGQPCPKLDGLTLIDRKTLGIGPFRITPFLVDHSAFDAYAFLVEAGGKSLFYSGDFRMHGRKSALVEKLIRQPPAKVDALLMEGSSLSRLDLDAKFPTESALEKVLFDGFKNTAGLALVHTSAQNLDRIVTIYRACKRAGRTLVIDLYAATILAATGGKSIPQSDWPNMALYVPESQRRLIKRNGWFDLLARHSGKRIYRRDLHCSPANYVMLFRPLMMPDLDRADALHGAAFFYSQWQGYLEKGSYAQMQDWLESHQIELSHVHTSGHASPPDLKRFVEGLAPEVLVPIHSFSPEKYAELYPRVDSHEDGVWWGV